MQIEILSQKSVTKPTKNGKTYQQLEVAYKNLTFQGKVEGKNIMSFGATANTFKTLATAQPGEVYDIEVVKNDAGYNDWVSAKKSSGGAQTAAPRAATVGATSATTTKSTYETPEERAKKQVYIVRQSSISSAIALLSVGAKAAPKTDDVIGTARQLEAYVFGDNVAKAVEGDMRLPIEAFPENDDIPY